MFLHKLGLGIVVGILVHNSQIYRTGDTILADLKYYQLLVSFGSILRHSMSILQFVN
jgi:hypothetical protein